MRRVGWLGAALVAVCLVLYLGWGADRRGPAVAHPATEVDDGGGAATAVEEVSTDSVETRTVATPVESDASGPQREAVASEEPAVEEPRSFSLSGVVLPGPDLAIEEDAQVRVFRIDRGKRHEVGAADVGEDGSWEPIEVLREPGEFLARFQSFQAIPVELELGRPAAGEVVRVEFQVEKGEVLFFEVDDPAGEMIRDATITGTWRGPDGRTMSRTAFARPDGYYAMRGLPPGVVITTAEAEGFVAKTVYFVAPEKDPVIHVFALDPAEAGIRGIVRQGGAPVADFDVIIWPTKGSMRDIRTVQQRDSDGKFELDGLASGPYLALVNVVGSNQSPAQSIDVPQEGFAEVEIEVPAPVFLRGRVVSARDGEPLRGATVQALVSGANLPYLELGDPLSTDGDGRFEGLPVTTGTTLLRLRAAEHATLDVPAPEPGSPTDMGDLSLQPAGTLEIRLVGSPGTDLTRFLLEPRSAGLPMQRFPEDGVLHLSVASGYQDYVLHDTRADFYLLRYYLYAGEESWTREVRVSGGPRLTIALHDAGHVEGTPWPLTWFTVLDSVYSLETVSFRCWTDGDSLVLDNMNPGRIQIKAYQDRGIVGEDVFVVTDEPEQFFDLEIGVPGRRIRFVDGEGAPVPGAEVQLFDPQRDMDFGWRVTDEDGRVPPIPCRRRHLSLTVRHRTLGSYSKVPITLPEDPEEEYVFVLEPQHSVQVHLTYRGAPATGVEIQLVTASYDIFDYRKTSDGEGLVHWTSVPSGDYILRVEQAEYWVEHSRVTVGDSDQDLFVELRKLGRFELRVSNAEGLPVNGARVDLRFLDLGADVTALAAENRLGLPDGGMVTGGRGTFAIKNLPEGRYRWSVPLAGGDALSGVVLIEPGELARATAVLP